MMGSRGRLENFSRIWFSRPRANRRQHDTNPEPLRSPSGHTCVPSRRAVALSVAVVVAVTGPRCAWNVTACWALRTDVPVGAWRNVRACPFDRDCRALAMPELDAKFLEERNGRVGRLAKERIGVPALGDGPSATRVRSQQSGPQGAFRCVARKWANLAACGVEQDTGATT